MGLLILGAAYAVSTLQQSSVEAVRPRTELERLIGDGITVLAGLEDNGTSLLDLYVAQALHCAVDASPSQDECDGRRSENLSIKVESYLPLGAGYAVGLGNGAAVREIYRSPLPQGEAVSTSRTVAFEWNLTFVASELSCYESAMDVNLTLIPIASGAPAWARYANVTVDGVETAGARAFTPDWWNVTLPAATRPGSGTVVVNATSNATLNGTTSYAACEIGGAGPLLRTALRDTQFASTAPTIPIGGELGFEVDLSPIAAVAGVTIGAASVDVYEPVPPRPTVDGWLDPSTVTLTGGMTRVGTWDVPGHSLYGTHVALLRIPVTVAGQDVELRKPIVFDVGLASGEVPIDPPYRVTLQAWLPDWG